MRRTIRGLLVGVACITVSWPASVLAQAPATDAPPQKRIVAYLPGYATNAKRNYSIENTPGVPTHLIYGFAGLRDNGNQPATVTTPEPKDPTKNFVKLAAFHTKNPWVALMISVGGWNQSHAGGAPGQVEPTPLFAKIAADPGWRKAFVASVLDTFIRKRPSLFVGIDLDWEFPTLPADKANFVLLASEFRSQLKAQGAVDQRQYLFSVAINIDPNEIDLPAVSQFVDFFNVMAYNLHGPRMTPGDVTNFENPLHSTPDDPTAGFNVGDVIDKLLATGVPSTKLVLGVTSYARSYAGVDPTNDGLYQSYSGPGPGTFTAPGIITFKDLRVNYFPKCKQHSIGAWHSSWLYCKGGSSASKGTFISYESVEEVREKAVFVGRQSLGGLMLWELGADDNAALLREANQILNSGCVVGSQFDACRASTCNDGTCQSGIVNSCAIPLRPACTNGCANHGGVNGTLSCSITP